MVPNPENEEELLIDENLCLGCCVCIAVCPSKPKVITLKNGIAKVVNPEACIKCNVCIEYCPVGAIKLLKNSYKQVD